MEALLDAHETASGSFALAELAEVYAADYQPGPDGFDPADSEERCGGVQGFTYLTLAYRREYVDRGDVLRYLGKQELPCRS